MRSPLAGWMGGKSRLAKAIVARIPEHVGYVEPFAGAAWVIFTKPESKAEVLNDINGDLINLYRVIKHHLEEFVRQFKWLLVSREEFQRFKDTPPETMTDIQRAVRFYYMQKLAFGGKVTGRTFGISAACPPRLNLMRIEEEFSAAHLRLARVTVENLGYKGCLERYDRPETFFYLDPPYWGAESVYGKALFSKADFEILADLLANLRGKFLLSINDTPETREIFRQFKREETSTTYSCAKTKPKRASELFITNYPLPTPEKQTPKRAA